MALPVLPKEHIAPAFYKITKYVVEADESAGLNRHKRLVEYMRSTWIESSKFPPSSWCVHRRVVRTNNDVEGWHSRLIRNAKLGNQPLYKLVSLLGREARIVELNCVLVKEQKLSRRQNKTAIESTQKLIKLWDAYAEGSIQYPKLLSKASRLMQTSKPKKSKK